MSCKITYNSEGKITGVKDLNGKDSVLFKQIVSNPHISAEQGVEIYKQTFSDKIKTEELESNNIRFKVGPVENNTPIELTEQLIDRLKQTGLVENVELLTNEEIMQKLEELGLTEVQKQKALIENPWKSTAKEGLSKITQNAATPAQWVKMITDKGGKGTSQELDWIGLEDYLNEYLTENKTKSVPKEVVEQYINDNQIEIVEVTKDDKLAKDYEIIKSDTPNRWDVKNTDLYIVEDEGDFEVYSNQDVISVKGTLEEAKERALEEAGYEENDVQLTKYSKYTLEGGENYREVLLTLREKKIDKSRVNEIEQREEELYYKKRKIYEDIDSGKIKKSDVIKDIEAISKEEMELSREKDGTPKENYKSSHWEEANILAHVRMNERTITVANPNYKDPESIKLDFDKTFILEDTGNGYKVINKNNGKKYAAFYSKERVKELGFSNQDLKDYLMTTELKKEHEEYTSKIKNNTKNITERVLFIEEVQSDWAQEGKKKGFVETGNFDETKVSTKKVSEKFIDIYYDNQWVGKLLTTYSTKAEIERDILRTAKTDFELKKKAITGKTPNMPYKKTDQWVGMAMRRVMQMATQEGFDRVAWVTGEQSADRYDLSKSVDNISWANQVSTGDAVIDIILPNDKIKIVVNRETGNISNTVSGGDFNGKNLEELIGKDLSSKILKDKSGKLQGDGLKVGGEGMKTFYNSILPKVAKKEAQRFDKSAKVEVVDFGNTSKITVDRLSEEENQYTVFFTNGQQTRVRKGDDLGDNVSVSEIEQYYVVRDRLLDMNEEVGDKKVPSKQLSIKLTEKAKQNLNEAIPLFQKQDGGVKGFVFNNNVYLNTESMSLDTPIHEFSHLYNSWTKQNRPELYEKGVSLIEEELNKDNSEIQDVIDFVKRTQPDLKGEALKEEILTELIGRRGTNLLNSNKQSSIADWLREVWNSIKNALGLSQYSIEEVRNMNIGEYSDAVAVDLLRGEPIEKMFSNKILGNSEVKIEVQYLEEAKKQELIDQGLLTEEPNLNFLANQKVVTTSPDDMLVGNVNIYNMDGKNISTKRTTEGSGGLFFVTKYGEIWAFRNESGAKKFTTIINKIRKDNGGKTWLLLTKGGDSKLMSNPQGVTNSLNVTTSLMEAGFISKSDMRKAVSDAVKKYEDVINIPLTATTEEIKKRVAEFFENEKNISFVKRGDVLRQIITNLNATDSFKKNRTAIAEFLGVDPNNFTLKGQVQDAIALVSSEKFTQGLESGDIYAAIEINNDVFVEKGIHGVFEASIIEKDPEGNKVIPKLTLIGGNFSAYTNMQTEEGKSLQEVDSDIKQARKSFRARVTGGGNTGFGKGIVSPEVRFSKSENKNKPVAGNRIFNDPLEGVSEIADEYSKKSGIPREKFEGVSTVDKGRARVIADLFEQMENNPTNSEVKKAYEQMAKETLEQYKTIVSKGYQVEVNNNEPYNNSQEMIEDLRENKNMKIFSTESGFGDEIITETQRKENSLLRKTEFTDKNGVPLLVNDIFRFVHDFFGHAELGNGFGAIGEENAWNVHARMFSPLARRAMTTETRGQNSWVNFSGINDEAFKKRNEARKLRREGRIEESKQLVSEAYEEMSFADQKVGLLPEWVSDPNAKVEFGNDNFKNLTPKQQALFLGYELNTEGSKVVDGEGNFKYDKRTDVSVENVIDRNLMTEEELKIIDSSDIKIISMFGGRGINEGMAFYNSKTKKIAINVNNQLGGVVLSDQNQLNKSIVHEYIHAILDNEVQDKETFEKELDDIRKVLVENKNNASSYVQNIIGHMEAGSSEEVLTYMLTIKEVAEFMHSIPSTKTGTAVKETLWTKLVKLIKGILQGNTLATEALDILNRHTESFWSKNIQDNTTEGELIGAGLREEYRARITEVKNQNPTQYWSVDIPSQEDLKKMYIYKTEGGMALMDRDGNLGGLFKDGEVKKVTRRLQEARIKDGGIKTDNYDGYLTELYKNNGFRVVSRIAFNEDLAKEGWKKEVHGTPDVVFMVYDPQGQLDIEEKYFEKDSYEEALSYRESFIEKAKAIHPYYKNESQQPIVKEPTLTYSAPNNQEYPTFKEALKNTQTGEIQALVGGVPLFTIDSSTDYNTYNGTINGLIKSGILSGESILEPTGEKVILTEGVGDIIKVINSVIAKEALIKAVGRSNIKETIDSNFIISEAGVGSVQIRNSEGVMENIPLDTLENKVKEELKKQFPDTYMDIIAMQAYRTLFKGTSNQTEGSAEIEFTPENELQQALISLLNKMGVKITSITDYVVKFAAKNGVEPSAAALADLANLIVAFKDGVITQAELSEEVAHFIVETLPEAEIENLLRNIHRTAEWQQHSDNYFKIYREQNPNISEEELEQLVRKEILGKVLAAGFENNFNAEAGSETQKSILQKLAELFNNFIEKIRARFKPQYETELENWTNKVYANLMADDLYDQLDETQLQGKNYLMYSSSKKVDDPITQINVRAQKAVNILESNVGRLREGSSKTELNQYRADLEKLDEQSKILGVSGIVGVAKRQTAYLKKILDANKKQNHPFTQDENAVYINTVGVMLNYMTEIRSLLEPSNKNHKRIIEQVDGLIKDINTIKGDKNILQDTAWQNMLEELTVKLSLTPTEKQQLLDAYTERTDQNGNKVGGQGKKDTNWFFAHIAPMVHAQDPALNMASNIISKMTMRHGINTYNRIKSLFDKWEKLGITEPNKLLKTWKKGSYLFNPIKYEILDQEILEKKIELYKKATGEELSPEEFQEAEKTENLNFNSVVDQVNFYEDISEFRKENHYVDYLTKEARVKRNKMYEGLSKEAVRIDKNLSRERGQVGQEADRFGSYTQEHKYRLQQINKKRQRAKNPYNGDGQLKPGLIMQAGEIVKDPRVQNIDVDAQIVLDLQELDKRKMEAFKEKNKEDKAIPQRFKDLLGVAQTEEESIELLFLNANISFTNDFWDSLAANDSFVTKLEAKADKTDKTIEIIERLKSLQKRRSAILKANKVHNLPSEIDFEEMEGSEIMAIKDLSEQLQAAYQEARNELGETTNEETQDPVFSSVVNEAYREQIKNRSLEESAEEEFEFIKEHTTKSDSLLLEKARGIAEDIIRGREPRLSDFYRTVFQEEYTGTDEEIREEVYQDLVDYSKGKLLPYFKRIEPNTGQSFTQVMEMLKGGQKTALDFISEFEAGQYPSIQVTPNYIFFDETNNDERNPEYDKNERLGLPQIQPKYRDSEFADYFGFDYNTGNVSKNANEYQAWQALVEFHEESLEITNMKDRHNKFLLPQKGVRGARQMHKLLSGPNKLNTLKEVIKDMTSFRQDEKEYGETSNGRVLGGKEGDLRIPKYGFNKLDNQLDLTDELLESYIWMGSEAELYTARVGAFADMEGIKNLIANNTYSNKEGEKSRIYKMFDSFYRYNIYGQNEEFSYETDFFGILPKKMNLAPLAKKLQFWVRLVNLGFNLIVPLTSILQGGVNLTIERFVGERIDKDAAKLARRDLPKYLTEAVGDTLALNSKSKMSSMAELLGVFEIEGRFRNSNYNKFTRGMLKTGFITHSIADAPIKAQVMLTVLKDMRIVDGDVINFNRFRQQRMFEAKEKGETVNDKQLREQWRKYEDKTFDKYMSTKDGITQIEKQKLKDDLFGNTPVNEIEFEDILDLKLQFIRDSIQRTAQEIDTMIPNEERSFAQRHAIFSFFFLHRGWMTVAYNRKFKGRHLNTHTGITEEGNWNGSAEFIKEWINEWKNPNNTKTFLKTLKSQWQGADDTRRRSMHRTMVEVLMVNSLAALSLLLMGMADDEEDSWPAQFGAYMGYRVANETITATVAYPRQVMDFLESPIVGLDKIRAASDIWDLTSGDLVERGKYKDQTKRMRFIYKNLPAFKEYYNVKNASQTRDTYEFYNRPNFNFPWTATAYFMSQNKG